MTAARIVEIRDQVTDLRARAQKSEAAAYDAGLNLTLANAHQRAANELWRQVHDLEARKANLTAGLAEDFGKPEPVQPAPVPAAAVVKRAPLPEDDFPIPGDYPSALPKEERSKLYGATVEKISRWLEKMHAAGAATEMLVELAAADHVHTSWSVDRINALEQRCAELEMALAKRETSPSGKKLDGLAARVAELEAGGVIYAGVYQRSGVTYRKGSLVTADGSGWIALREAKEGEAPGASNAWQLAIKRGKDGRDAR
ncbi:hypothetical protein [Bosea sp. TAF32]|uniref:hypothetical protein n=1 Tax=Bosea sp. TAF32 TaxID=3237482 RepID=UPI003F8F6FC7